MLPEEIPVFGLGERRLYPFLTTPRHRYEETNPSTQHPLQVKSYLFLSVLFSKVVRRLTSLSRR